MNCHIRPAAPDDIEVLLSLTLQLIQTEKKLEPLLTADTESKERLRSRITKYLLDQEEITLTAVIDNTVVGFIQGGIRDLQLEGKVVYLNYLAVDQTYRKQSVGDLLMDAFIEASRKQHGDYIVLQVLESNIPAKNLYKKKGFRPMS